MSATALECASRDCAQSKLKNQNVENYLFIMFIAKLMSFILKTHSASPTLIFPS